MGAHARARPATARRTSPREVPFAPCRPRVEGALKLDEVEALPLAQFLGLLAG